MWSASGRRLLPSGARPAASSPSSSETASRCCRDDPPEPANRTRGSVPRPGGRHPRSASFSARSARDVVAARFSVTARPKPFLPVRCSGNRCAGYLTGASPHVRVGLLPPPPNRVRRHPELLGNLAWPASADLCHLHRLLPELRGMPIHAALLAHHRAPPCAPLSRALCPRRNARLSGETW